ncbi:MULTISPECIES: 2-dehydro-3-deoxygalactonokinase [unclassified Haematobacter]|uniref:2-dehydro-3-deoxygalactonokinase n=1 Tax=unclassified Haematobacter TaxID=2640585 RepID=UPI0025B8CAB1|nr:MULTISPECIES: 2-dehydro-3-deoxygalactonokinase [unclassified Haematobacter]
MQRGVEWIAADWGTTNLRLWAMAADDRVLARRASEEGMGRLSPECYEQALIRMVGDWLPEGRVTPVLICGMAGARQGWVEAGYRPVPAHPLGLPLTRVPTSDPRISVTILPGLSQESPADVMRGEETQIAGALALRPGLAGPLCLPGTHSKWAEVEAGRVIRFTSYPTGELFALLSEKSVLRHGLTGEGEDWSAFDAAVAATIAAPARVWAELFPLRAAFLLHGLPAAAGRSRLSGLLIGAELAAAEPRGEVTLIGAGPLMRRYARALRIAGVTTRQIEAEDAVLAGLSAARALWKEAV